MIRRTIVLPIVILLCFVLLTATAWATDKFTWPVGGEVIKRFGLDEHRGIDIAGNTGDSIVAAQDGVVYWIGKTPRGEPCVSIDHPGGITTTYLPVTVLVSKGQSVKAGDSIGKLSSEIDKSSSAQHLHFGLFETATRDNKKYLDPCNYLPDVSDKAEDKHEPAMAVDISSGSNIEKLPEGRELSTVNKEAHPVVTEQPQQRVAMSPIDAAEKPMENTKPEIQPSLSMSSPKAGEAALLDRSPRNSTSAINKLSQDTAIKVGLPNLSWVAPEVKPDLVPAVDHGMSTVKMVSPPKTREPVMSADGYTKSGLSTISNRAHIKVKNNSMAVYTSPPAMNPFKQAVSVKQLVDRTKREVPLAKRATKQNPTMAQRLFKWQFLPESTSALAILLIAMISYQCTRSAKEIGASLTGVASASC